MISCHSTTGFVFLFTCLRAFHSGMRYYIKLVAKKRPHPSKLQETLASVHDCNLVLGHQLLVTISSDEFKNGQKIALLG